MRALAAQLAINPNTIQRAYNELEGEGYIYSVPGKGSFAAANAAAVRNSMERNKNGFMEHLIASGPGRSRLPAGISCQAI